MSRKGSKPDRDVEDILDAAVVRQGVYKQLGYAHACTGEIVTVKKEIRN